MIPQLILKYMSTDYYTILGVEKNATNDDIKKAFRKLAQKYHPDKKGGDESKFKEVNEAYQILSNEKKRSEYDTYGQTFKGGNQGFGGFDFSGAEFDFGNLGDIFGDFFSGGAQRGAERRRRGRDITTEIEISFQESILGVDRSMLLEKTTTCNACSGTGAENKDDMETCSTCNGKGKIHETRQSVFGVFTNVKTCDRCLGQGKVPKNPCKACKGNGVTKGQQEITIKIPAGIADGEMVRLRGVGEAIHSGESGDLYVRVYVKKHPIFTRQGKDIYMRLDIKLTDALLGATYTIPTPAGKNLEIKVPAGISPEEILRVAGRGVPLRGGKGDLMIKIHIKIPNHLSKEVKALVEKLRNEGV